MFYRTIFVCFVGFVLAKAEQDRLEITFEITSMKVKNGTKITCDHNINDIHKKIYTVREGEQLTIITKYNSFINHCLCNSMMFITTPKTNYNKNVDVYNYSKKNAYSKEITVEKRTGNIWNCTVLTNRNNPKVLPVVEYKGHTYSAAYCFMRIHVRQTNSPQTILVNNMVLKADRTDLSEKDVDFTAEYQYVDGDVVNVTCANLLNPAPLTMEYAMAGTMSDDSIMKELSSNEAIGFRVKLHSGHKHSYMICTHTEPTDYTKIMVRFVMQAELNIITIRINGMTLRPKLKNVLNNQYDIEYKYPSDQHINVVCEVQRTDMKLVVEDRIDFVGKVSSYKKRELIPTKKAEMSFSLKPMDAKKLECACDSIHSASAERVLIHFTAGNFLTDQYPLHMELPLNGTVMELYSDDKLKIIFYEFEDGETLHLKCGPLFVSGPGPVLYLQMNDSDCQENDCTISKTLQVTNKDENTEIACYLKEKHHGFKEKDKVLREIRVILRERFVTTTTSIATNRVKTTTNPKSASKSSETSNTLVYYMSAVAVAVFIVILIILYLSVKKRGCCKESSSQELPSVPTPRPEPGSNYYENMLPIFKPINDREAAEMEPQYEEIQ